jgi:hypothetical protein
MVKKKKLSKRKRVKIFSRADILETTRNLLKSYHSDTDVLSELIQNSINNLLLFKSPNPSLSIAYNLQANELEVRDNGTGFTEQDMQYFALGTSGTRKIEGSLGAFGYGAAYILAASDYFELESVSEDGYIRAICDGAYDSIMNKSKEPEFFIVEREESDLTSSGTKILVKVDPSRLKPFKNWDDLEREVRTKTAAGYTKKLFSDTWDVKVEIKFNDKKPKYANFGYRSLAEDMPDKIVDFENVDTQSSYRGNILRLVDTEQDDIKVYLLLASTEIFKRYNVNPGITLSYRGNPLQVEIKTPSTKSASTWRNVHLILQFDELELDPGRKSIMHGSRTRVGVLASKYFTKVVDFATLFIKGQEEQARKAALGQIKEWAQQSLTDITMPEGVRYCKIPDKEQGVIALFHELVGAGYLSNYKTLFSAQDAAYDAVILYESSEDELGASFRKLWKKQLSTTRPKGTGWTAQKYTQKLMVEFKITVREFISDRKKSIDDVDLLVVWSGREDKLPAGWRVAMVPDVERIYQGVQYKLMDQIQRETWIMFIENFVERNE